MPKLYMTIGLPGSGKSTWAAEQTNCKIVNLDAIRKELYGDENIQGDGNYVAKIGLDQIYEYTSNGYDVVYDACNVKKKYRKQLLDMIGHDAEIIAVWFNKTKDKCLVQNNGRDRKVPKEVIDRMYLNFEEPTFEEGFSKILIKL